MEGVFVITREILRIIKKTCPKAERYIARSFLPSDLLENLKLVSLDIVDDHIVENLGSESAPRLTVLNLALALERHPWRTRK